MEPTFLRVYIMLCPLILPTPLKPIPMSKIEMK